MMEQPEPDHIFDTLKERKDELVTLSEEYPEHNARYAEEIEMIESMIDKVDEEDFDATM